MLRLSNIVTEGAAPGQIINLMSNNVNKFDYFFTFFHYIWVTPIQVNLFHRLCQFEKLLVLEDRFFIDGNHDLHYVECHREYGNCGSWNIINNVRSSSSADTLDWWHAQRENCQAH